MQPESFCNQKKKKGSNDESFLIFIRSQLCHCHNIRHGLSTRCFKNLILKISTIHYCARRLHFHIKMPRGNRAGLSCVETEHVIRKREWAEVGLPVELTWQSSSARLNLILEVSHQFTHTAGPVLCTPHSEQLRS